MNKDVVVEKLDSEFQDAMQLYDAGVLGYGRASLSLGGGGQTELWVM